MLESHVHAEIRRVKRRYLLVSGAAGLCWALLAGALLLFAAVWLDLLWELSPAARIGSSFAAVALAAIALVVLLMRSSVDLRDGGLARRFDEAGATGGLITSGWDLERAELRAAPGLTRDLAERAIAQAAHAARQIPGARVVSGRAAVHAAGALATLLAVAALVALLAPNMAGTQWRRFAQPWADVPPFTSLEFVVEPGDAKVVYGDAIDVHASTSGPQVEQLELVYRDGDIDETVPMFQQQDGRWRATLARVTSPSRYFVRSGKARSRQYGIAVITVPKLSAVRLRVTPPAYTRDAPYEGPLPPEGLAGLPGTQVEFWARSNRPLASGLVAISGASGAATAALAPAGQADEVYGGFRLDAAGKFELRVTDVDGQQSQDSLAGSIVLLADERPLVRLLEPRPMSLATPHSQLPVETAAEDDYGVARVHLYRSVNNSRATPLALAVAAPPPRRFHDRIYLPLSAYGLEPGDEIKLFARAEDNNPGGLGGAESQVVTVRIIAQEEFERLVRMREGIQVLISKYQQAERRMEALAAKIDELQKELAGLPADSPLAEARRNELEELVAEMRKEAAEIAAAGKRELPYDIDGKLSEHLQDLAEEIAKAASALEQAQSSANATAGQAAAALAQAGAKLRGDREKYRQQTTEPLAHLEKVFPLLQDQAKFIQLAADQRDLAERLAAVKNEQSVSDPAVRARMRDLEEEQGRLNERLTQLIRDIESHVAVLPPAPEFDKLRSTAESFVRELGQSGAGEAMTEAKEALEQFSGAQAHSAATKAAEILESFISTGKCEGLGNDGKACLAFQPSLKQCLGNSVSQLLAEMGLGAKSGSGFGPGSGGGYSAMRGGQDYGLYGGLPGVAGPSGSGFGNSRAGNDGPGGALGASGPREAAVFAPADNGGAVVGAQAAVPAKYRRRIGEYFRRINEETE